MSGEDEYMTCPLDKSHRILKSRIQVHLTRCKKNHDMTNKDICPFNSTHIVDKKDLEAHVETCEDMKEVHSIIFTTDDRENPGIISVQEVLDAQKKMVNSGENWDDEPYVATYDPMKATENREVIRTLMVAPKSEKKLWRQQERQKMAQFDNKPACTSSSIQDNKSVEHLRPPRNTALQSSTGNTTAPTISKDDKRKSNTVANQLATSLKYLNISEKNDDPEIKKREIMDAKVELKSFSNILKEHKTPGKLQTSKK